MQWLMDYNHRVFGCSIYRESIKQLRSLAGKFIPLPEVFAVVEVPGRRVTHHFSSLRLLQHGSFPEFVRHPL